LKILYISSKKGWGGVASWMIKTARELQQRGHSIWILSHPESKINAEFPADLYLIPHKLGFEYNPMSIAFIAKLINRLRIQLIVTNLEKEVAIGGFAARIAGIPNIRRIGREDDFNTSFKNRWNHKKFVFANIVPCDAVKHGAKRRAPWLNTDNFKTIYNGRNPAEFGVDEIKKQRDSWGITESDLVIGFTGQLLKVKQVDQLLECFTVLKQKHKNLKLVICGTGKEEDNLKQLTVDLKIEQDVIFAGFTNNPLLAAAAYDIAVLNSRLEGFPNTVVEYFAARKPVVSTNVGGVSEIIEDGKNGFLVQLNKKGEMIQKIETLIQDKSLRNKFSQNSLETLMTKFSEKIMVDELEKYFHEQIKRHVKLH
jgi:glycosyltransferase involved in cell wall biosynthesis